MTTSRLSLRFKYSSFWMWLSLLTLFLTIGFVSAQQSDRDTVFSVAWSPDGTRIAVGGYGIIRLYDADTQEYLYRLRAFDHPIGSLAWSLDSTYLISNDYSDNSIVWDVATGNIQTSYGTGQNGMAPIISRSEWNFDGSLIADDYAFGTQLSIRDGLTGKRIDTTHISALHKLNPLDFAWSENQNQFAISTFDNMLVLFDATTWQKIGQLNTEYRVTVDKWHGNYLYTMLDYNPQLELLNGTSYDESRLNFRYILQVWDIATQKAISSFDIGSVDTFQGRLWSPDGSKVAVWRSNNILQIWDTMTGQVIQSQQFTQGRQAYDWSPDSTRIALVYAPDDIRIITLPLTGERLPPPPSTSLTYFSNVPENLSHSLALAKVDEAPYEPGVDYVGWYGLSRVGLSYGDQSNYYDWSADGNRFIYARITENDYQIFEDVIDYAGEAQLTTQDGWNLFPAYSPADFAQEAQIAYLHSDDEKQFDLYLMSGDRLSARPLIEAQMLYVERPGWLDQNTITFSMHNGQDYDIYLIDLSRELPEPLVEHPGNDHYPEWSPHGKQLAFVSDKDQEESIYIFDVETGDIQLLTAGSEPEWSPDGRYIAFVHDKNVYFIDPAGENRTLFIENASTPRWAR